MNTSPNTDPAAVRYDSALGRAHDSRLPAGHPRPQPTCAWPAENVALLEHYRHWLLSSGASADVTKTLYIPMAGHALGLNLKPPPELDVDADLERALDYIKALENPAQLDTEYLQTIAGDYGPRHLTVEDGSLFYSRAGASTSAPRPLRALSKDTFILEGVTYFKLQVVFDEQGNPIKLVGHYDEGRTDETPRDSE